MPNHFHIEMLPAGYGDSLWIEYGDEETTHRILIDGGLASTLPLLQARICALPEDSRHIELVVCTHMDGDHINGLLSLFRDPPKGLKIGDVWFNGWDQIKGSVLGAMQAEKFDAYIRAHNLNQNAKFDGNAVQVPEDGNPLSVMLPGDMKVTILGPTSGRLIRLAQSWKKIVEKLGFTPGQAVNEVPIHGEPIGGHGVLGRPDIPTLANLPFSEDSSVANGSSIALILEYRDKRALLTGDAFPSDLLTALKRWNLSGTPFAKFDVFKISHHGGKSNTSPAMLKYVACPHYLISTNGVRNNHPDAETLARILVHAPRLGASKQLHLHFNYCSTSTLVWDDAILKQKHKYEAHYPPKLEGLSIRLL